MRFNKKQILYICISVLTFITMLITLICLVSNQWSGGSISGGRYWAGLTRSYICLDQICATYTWPYATSYLKGMKSEYKLTGGITCGFFSLAFISNAAYLLWMCLKIADSTVVNTTVKLKFGVARRVFYSTGAIAFFLMLIGMIYYTLKRPSSNEMGFAFYLGWISLFFWICCEYTSSSSNYSSEKI